MRRVGKIEEAKKKRSPRPTTLERAGEARATGGRREQSFLFLTASQCCSLFCCSPQAWLLAAAACLLDMLRVGPGVPAGQLGWEELTRADQRESEPQVKRAYTSIAASCITLPNTLPVIEARFCRGGPVERHGSDRKAARSAAGIRQQRSRPAAVGTPACWVTCAVRC